MGKRVLAFISTLGASMALLIAGLAPAVSAATTTVYNNIPSPQPGNVASLGYEATQTGEFGSQIGLAGSDRNDPVITVLMSSWACEEGHWSHKNCVSSVNATFSHPITVNVYNVGSANSVGSLIVSQTKSFDMPYRPSADDTNCTGDNDGKWYDGEACNNGKAFTISFNLSGVTLPDNIIIGVAYNTSHYGKNPVGESPACYGTEEGCPYDSLNVGTNPIPSVGTSLPSDTDAYWDTKTAGYYCDSGAGGTGVFRIDEGCWGEYLPAIKVDVNVADQKPPHKHHRKHHHKRHHKRHHHSRHHKKHHHKKSHHKKNHHHKKHSHRKNLGSSIRKLVRHILNNVFGQVFNNN